jgi:hypothetical protein
MPDARDRDACVCLPERPELSRSDKSELCYRSTGCAVDKLNMQGRCMGQEGAETRHLGNTAQVVIPQDKEKMCFLPSRNLKLTGKIIHCM